MSLRPVNAKALVPALLTALVLTAWAAFAQAADKPPAKFLNQEEAVIAVTDSGLGGLNLVAALSNKLKKGHPFKKVHIIFVNALFSPQGGYNSLTSRGRKIQVFDSCLKAIHEKYRPHIIFIACNTLSVLFNDTAFAKKKTAPVVGIVDTGVKLMAAKLEEIPKSQVAILGTQTTIGEGTYQKRLIQMGIAKERIIGQACPELQAFIEKGFDSEETRVLISAYADEVVQKKKKGAPLLVSFNCTHYGYALKAWKDAFEELNCPVEAFIDPTAHMIDFIFAGSRAKRFKKTQTDIKAVSMVPIAGQAVKSLGRYFRQASPETALALANYELRKNLFEWKSIVPKR